MQHFLSIFNMNTYCRIGIIVVTLRSTFKETLFGAHKTRLWQFGATQRFKEIKSKNHIVFD